VQRTPSGVGGGVGTAGTQSGTTRSAVQRTPSGTTGEVGTVGSQSGTSRAAVQRNPSSAVVSDVRSTGRVAVPRGTGSVVDDRHAGGYDYNGRYYSHHPHYSHYPYYHHHSHYHAHGYYYYPYYQYPYGYGAFGIGFYYYNPYVWAPIWYYNGYNYGYGYGYPIGEVRLQVRPRHAEVYIDGNYAGLVDDFDGTFQSLRLEEGTYSLQIVAPGYEPLEFDIQVQPGRKINYKGDLLSVRPGP
jgi:hypothetical protein